MASFLLSELKISLSCASPPPEDVVNVKDGADMLYCYYFDYYFMVVGCYVTYVE